MRAWKTHDRINFKNVRLSQIFERARFFSESLAQNLGVKPRPKDFEEPRVVPIGATVTSSDNTSTLKIFPVNWKIKKARNFLAFFVLQSKRGGKSAFKIIKVRVILVW